MSTLVEEAPAAQPSSTRRERVGWYFYAFATTWLGRRHVAGVRAEHLVEADAA